MSGFGLILGNYVRRGYAYRWIVLVPTVLVFALVTLYVSIQPDTYESHAILMKPIANAADVQTRNEQTAIARDMFRSAAERLLSNRMLAQVIEKTDPYPELRETKGLDAVIDQLRENLRVDINRATGAISITCAHSEGDRPGETAANVVNTLTDLFVRSQRDALEDEVNKHKMFLDREKARTRKDLETAQSLLEEFKEKHVNQLPEDVERNQAQIDRLARDVLDFRSQQRDYEGRIAALNRELARLDAELALAGEGRGPVDLGRALQAGEAQLKQLKLALQTALFTYAPDHENVLRIKHQIATLEKLNDELRSSENNESMKKREEYLRYLIEENKKWVVRYHEEIKRIEDQITETDKKSKEVALNIATATRIDGEYVSLQRNVTEASSRYNLVADRFNLAEQRARLDDYASHVPVQVEQSAFVPAKPASPDRLITSLMGLVLGLGLGVGLAIARQKLDRAYHRPDDLRALLPGAVLVTVPEVRKGGTRAGVMVAAILGGLLLAAVFAATVGLLGIQVGWWGEPDLIRPLINLR